jgi:hypothetical protein
LVVSMLSEDAGGALRRSGSELVGGEATARTSGIDLEGSEPGLLK